MLKFIEKLLSEFRSCFTRTRTYEWFLVIISSLLIRSDSLGVTSFIRALSLDRHLYETMLHFFRSAAFKTTQLKLCWHKLIHKNAPFIRIAGRPLLLGDGCKVSKEAQYMPGVKKLCQESEDSSKPQFIHGHMFGGIGAAIGNHLNSFCIPLDLTIQDGLKQTASWIGGGLSSSMTHVVQMIRNGHAIAQTFAEDVYFALDRYFLTVPLLEELQARGAASPYHLDVITRAKTNCTAYLKPEKEAVPHRGRPRKKGDAVRLKDLFTSRQQDFVKTTVSMYGKEQAVEYLAQNLLWGMKLYQELQFVLVRYGSVTSILVSTDLELSPTLIIEAYAHRFKIECMFRELKQQIHGFSYHFWNSKLPKLNKYKKKSDPDPLGSVRKEDQKSVLLAIDAIERFVLCSEISMGLIQMIALRPAFVEMIAKNRYLRTSYESKVSEATVIEYLRKHFFRLLSLNRHSYISRLILSMQEPDFEESEAA